MMNEAQITVRNAGFLLAQRGFHIIAGLLFAIWVPRMMGPSDYGRYALINALYLWFVVGSDLGFTQIMGRYVPDFTLHGEKEKLQKFFSNLWVVSLLSGAIGAGLYLSFTTLWLTDLDQFLLMIMSATLLVQGGSRPFFTLFLGLNQAARWGMGETFHHWFLVFLVIVGFYLGGLRGAFMGLLLTEWLVLFIGAWWGRSYFSWKDLRLDLKYLIPYLRFGFMFFAFNLLASAFQRSGEVLVRFFYPDYVQVGYFGLANNVSFTISTAIRHFIIAFAPLLMTLQAKGELETIKQWLEHLINWLGVGAVFVVFGVLFLGNDLVPIVLGTAYHPVATNLLLLSLTLWVQVLGDGAVLLIIISNRPKIALMAAGIRLIAMWVFGPFLIARWGSLGGCFAFLAASTIYSGYLTWCMQKVMTYSLKKWAWAIVLGFLFLPLSLLKSSWSVNVVLYGIFVIGYCTLLLLLRFITLSEVGAVWRAFLSKGEKIHWSKS
jgi:O-antigen/teichoic acid export membrane protein